MSRSSHKGPFISARLVKKANNPSLGTADSPIRTWARASQIFPELVGKWMEIHNGRKFIRVFINEDMVGHRLGEFAPTRTFHGHGQVVKRLMTKT